MQALVGVSFPANRAVAEDLRFLTVIRNSLVHAEGNVKDKHVDSLKEYLSRHPEYMIKLTQLNEVKISYEYAKELLNLTKNIVAELETHYDSDKLF